MVGQRGRLLRLRMLAGSCVLRAQPDRAHAKFARRRAILVQRITHHRDLVVRQIEHLERGHEDALVGFEDTHVLGVDRDLDKLADAGLEQDDLQVAIEIGDHSELEVVR